MTRIREVEILEQLSTTWSNDDAGRQGIISRRWLVRCKVCGASFPTETDCPRPSPGEPTPPVLRPRTAPCPYCPPASPLLPPLHWSVWACAVALFLFASVMIGRCF